MPSKLIPTPAQNPLNTSSEASTQSKPVPLAPELQRQVGGGSLSPRPLPKGGW